MLHTAELTNYWPFFFRRLASFFSLAVFCGAFLVLLFASSDFAIIVCRLFLDLGRGVKVSRFVLPEQPQAFGE